MTRAEIIEEMKVLTKAAVNKKRDAGFGRIFRHRFNAIAAMVTRDVCNDLLHRRELEPLTDAEFGTLWKDIKA